MSINNFDFSSANILIVGVTTLDTYWYATTDRTSPEAPVPIAHYKHSDDRLAGAGLIAAIIKNLAKSATIDLMTQLGYEDDANNLILNNKVEHLLDKYQISTSHLCKNLKQTNHSIRIVSHSQQLLRVDEAHKSDLDKDNTELNTINHKFNNIFNDYNTIVFYEHNKFLKTWLLQCKQHHIKSIYIPDSLDAMQFFIKEQCIADYIIINQDYLANLNLDLDILERNNNCVLLVIGDSDSGSYRGLDVYNFINKSQDRITIPAITSEVENIIGVTEAIAGVFALGISSGIDSNFSALIANFAAQFTVRQFGQCVIDIVDLQLAYADYLLNSKFNNKYNFLNLRQEIAAARSKGQKIVFANGCFDVLHVGHIAYLDLARLRGDKLFVAINSDCSIRRLKGLARPINNLADRLLVLSALDSPSWIVPFFTDTPEDFLRWLQPDLLVKGGDYTEDGIVGREIVHAYGGEIAIIKHPYNQVSSTNIINSINNV